MPSVYQNPDLIDASVRAISTKPRNIVLVDVSWVLHRSWHAFRNMSAGGVRPTGHMYGFFSALKTIIRNIPDSLIILCKDGKPVRRQKLLADREVGYKAERPELEYNFYADYPKILAAASCLGNVYEAFLPDQESDDLMSNLCRQLKAVSAPGTFVYVYSGDDDLLQTIDDGFSCVVRTFDRGHPVKIDNFFLKMDERMLEKYHGCDSYHLPYYRAICGDKSDRMPGIPRFNREAAKCLAMDSCCIDDLFKREFRTDLLQYQRKLKENEDLVRLNFQLMALRDEFTVKLMSYSPSRSVVGSMLEKYHLNSFLHFLKERG